MQEDQKKVCKLCNKNFPCGRSLGGHMRSHVINISSCVHRNPDPKKKMKRTSNEDFQCKALFGHMKQESWNSSRRKKRSNPAERYDATTNIDHQDQQEVALSLILLSMDVKPDKNNEFGSKFTCVICKKGFPSYQALGGHRASHKKFKGCCAPTTESSSLQSENSTLFDQNKNKDHECPICCKVFKSGQALGGHKRSHIVVDKPKSVHPFIETQKRAPQIRDFLDLNLPAPVEDEWWIATTLLSSS